MERRRAVLLDDVDEPSTDAASFRSLTAITASERDAALAAGSVAFLLSDWVEQRFDLPTADLVDLFEVVALNHVDEDHGRLVVALFGPLDRPVVYLPEPL